MNDLPRTNSLIAVVGVVITIIVGVVILYALASSGTMMAELFAFILAFIAFALIAILAIYYLTRN